MGAIAKRATAAAAISALTLFASGCGETVIDDAKAEAAVRQNLAGIGYRVGEVECPSGVEVEAGGTFECAVRLADGEERTARLRIRNEDADVTLFGFSPKK